MNHSNRPFRTQRIADLTSPSGDVVRFVWYTGHDIVTVLTVHERQEMDKPNARMSWKIFRKSGWIRTDVAPFPGAAALSPAGLASHLRNK